MRRAYLDLSTAHVRHETSKWLDGEITFRGIYARHAITHSPFEKYGWWVWVDPDHDYSSIIMPDELAHILNEARKLDCAWVLFDCDSPKSKQFPTFDW